MEVEYPDETLESRLSIARDCRSLAAIIVRHQRPAADIRS
jgi:hypothetical protein